MSFTGVRQMVSFADKGCLRFLFEICQNFFPIFSNGHRIGYRTVKKKLILLMLGLFGRWGIGQEKQSKEIPIGKAQSIMKVDDSVWG